MTIIALPFFVLVEFADSPTAAFGVTVEVEAQIGEIFSVIDVSGS